MKKNGWFILFLFIVMLASSLSGETVLTDLYYRDYGYVTRAVVVASEKPQYSVEQRNDRFIVTVKKAAIGPSLPETRSFDSSIVSFVRSSDAEQAISIEFVLTGSFRLEHFYLDSERHRMVFDIYAVGIPETLEQKDSFVSFYTAVRYFDRAIELIKEVLRTNPERTGMNYYWGIINNRRGLEASAIEKLTQVKEGQREYYDAQIELLKMGVLNFEVPEDSEHLLYEHLQYFIKAGTDEGRKLMSAFLSGFFAEEQTAKQHIMSISQIDQWERIMLRNYNNTMHWLANDSEIESHFPEVSNSFSRTRRGVPIVFFILFAAIMLVISIIAISSMKKKLMDFKRVYVDFQAEMVAKNQKDNNSNNEQTDEPVQDDESAPEDKSEKDAEEKHVPNDSPTMLTEGEESTAAMEPTQKDGLSNISNPILAKEIAMKLFEKGWSVESIAVELQISDQEVEKLLT